MNSEIGLPLTVIGVPNAWRNPLAWVKNVLKGLGLILLPKDYPDTLILEIGADHPGDIKKVAKWLKTDIVVITKVSRTPVHVEFFKSPEEVFEEKASLADSLKKDGTLILFADDEKVMSIAERKNVGADSRNKIKVISFGLNENATVRGLGEAIAYSNLNGMVVPSGISFKVKIKADGQSASSVSDGQEQLVTVGKILGTAYEYPLLAAAAVGLAKGMSLSEIVPALNAYDAPRGRMNLIEGVNGSVLIDDTYNSSPDAALAALHAVKSLNVAPGSSKIAILGDMMELGKFAAEEHRKIGREAADAVSHLVTVGPRSKITAEEAVKIGLPADAVHSFDSTAEAAGHIAFIVKEGDVILIKGSQSMRMERVVKTLLKNPEQSSNILVRQEREWLEKK
jgi:UDP-N-acetylmuramoyl-tripeptide--D-alanyl-D-alanine ligase